MKYLFLFFLSLFIFGCAQQQAVYQPREVDIIGNELKADIRLLRVDSRVNRDLLEIELVGENTTNYKKDLIYRIDWFDRGGHLINTVLSSYKKLIIYPKDRFRIQEIAPNPNAVDYKIIIRE